jgi:hypothetical protein
VNASPSWVESNRLIQKLCNVHFVCGQGDRWGFGVLVGQAQEVVSQSRSIRPTPLAETIRCMSSRLIDCARWDGMCRVKSVL